LYTRRTWPQQNKLKTFSIELYTTRDNATINKLIKLVSCIPICLCVYIHLHSNFEKLFHCFRIEVETSVQLNPDNNRFHQVASWVLYVAICFKATFNETQKQFSALFMELDNKWVIEICSNTCDTYLLLIFYKSFYAFDRFKLRDVYFSLWGNLLVHLYLRFQVSDLHKFGLVGKALARRWFLAHVCP
jgi:hypothetical protein